MKKPTQKRQSVPEGLLSTFEAAELIGCDYKKMDNWRNQGGGPPFHRINHRAFYKLEEIEKFQKDRMNSQQLQSRINGLNGIAKKVYSAVPLVDPWTEAQIYSEVSRHGVRIDARTVRASLNALRNQGLIQEPSPSRFVNHQKESPVKTDAAGPVIPSTVNKDRLPGPVTMILAPKPAPTPESDPLDRLSAVAEWLLTMAGEVSEIAKRVEADRLKGGSDSAKLRQLQALLKGE